MKHLFFYTLLLFLIQNVNIHASIFESNTLQSMLQHANQDTLVVFDIDNTIAETHQYLGSDIWLCHKISELESKGFTAEEALSIMLPMYYVIHTFKGMKPIQNAPEIINKLQAMNIKTMALTNRSLLLVDLTIEQLKGMKIDFSKTKLFDKDLELDCTYAAKFLQGIIFCASNDKGKILFCFLNKIGLKPKKIIFIDDKINHVKSVESAAQSNNVEFIGIRFSGTDKTKAGFIPEIADKQMKEFKKNLGLLPL